jgi:hypothetical protein
MLSDGGVLYPRTYTKSVLVNTSSLCGSAVSDTYLEQRYPNPNLTCIASSWAATQIDLSTYRLATGSPYAKNGSCAPGDGKDMGANVDALWDAIDNAPGGSGGGGGGGATPHLGSPFVIPGTIQAEDYDDGGEGIAYHDTDAGNNGGAYRQEDVDIETTTDTGGGNDVGWFAAGEWVNYTANIQATGTFTWDVRIASPCGGGIIHLEVNGQDVSGPLGIPNTGGWNLWQTVSVSGIALSAGSVNLRVVADTASGGTCGAAVGNLNWFGLTQQSGGGNLPAPWHANDIGSVGQAGSASYSSGSFTVAGSGADIWGIADAFQFASQTVSGDVVVVARVVSEQNTNAFAKAGVMLRSSLDAMVERPRSWRLQLRLCQAGCP